MVDVLIVYNNTFKTQADDHFYHFSFSPLVMLILNACIRIYVI